MIEDLIRHSGLARRQHRTGADGENQNVIPGGTEVDDDGQLTHKILLKKKLSETKTAKTQRKFHLNILYLVKNLRHRDYLLPLTVADNPQIIHILIFVFVFLYQLRR